MQIAVRWNQARPRINRRRRLLEQARLLARLGADVLALASLALSLGLGLLILESLVR
ncbi:hypothetical protein G4Y73_12965 [Wenzhouxiangella sp. XN201]|uniref:hypothetical protein n=1 Tax=Wenzhouxiangella sp. XN201 TaxID=2710755 RepID=UPI0013CAB6E3|nr:hypothetical protein [Wenzhouxiangella sp. XN201]NEZ05060.1 hypothetical protein [Wenzhouxiangella sp. XN201]